VSGGVAKAGVGKLVASGVLKTAGCDRRGYRRCYGFVLAIALMIAVSWIFARSTPRRDGPLVSGGCSSSRLR